MTETYPTLSIETARRALDLHKSQKGFENLVEQATIWKDGFDLDAATVSKLSEKLNDLCDKHVGGGYKYDADASPLLHSLLELSPIVAGDPAFWRWLTFAAEGHLADLIDWRYESSGTVKETGVARDAYYGFNQPNQAWYMWLWLRADAVFDDTLEDPYELARRGDVDIWDSHIIGVDMGSAPPLARAFIRYVHPSDDKQRIPRGKNDKITKLPDPPGYRHLASEITRRNSSVSFEMLDEMECLELIDGIWETRETWLPIAES